MKCRKFFHKLAKLKTAPARETVQVAGLPKGVTVEISMIARR
ncbi:Rid family hydrolase [Flavobacterium sp.]|nr:Rid family hydrolase [Flavobacterium sp.]